MQNNSLAQLSLQQLKRAVVIREKIGALEKALNQTVGARASGPTKKGKMSAAAKARISAAMTARWAKAKKSGSSRLLRAGKASRPAAAKTRKSTAPGQLKERIIRSLKISGKSGTKVKDLASKLGTSYGNVSVWFHTTAKGVKEIRKIAPGKFAWVP